MHHAANDMDSIPVSQQNVQQQGSHSPLGCLRVWWKRGA